LYHQNIVNKTAARGIYIYNIELRDTMYLPIVAVGVLCI